VAEPRLFRVILPVLNIEVATSFYAELLGMPGDRVSPGRHYFSCGDTILACHDALADGDPARVGPNPQAFYFSVDDPEAIHERVRRIGLSRADLGASAASTRTTVGDSICFVDSKTFFTRSSDWPDR
jgi:catechol 2,3-dioxygenase-like lactoylglutathione lyase family enzyme